MSIKEKKSGSRRKKTNELRLGNLEEILQILGLIESGGLYFQGRLFNPKSSKMSKDSISDVLCHFFVEDGKMDWDRTFREAKGIFNGQEKEFQITGDKTGSYFVRKRDLASFPSDLKKSPMYRMLLILALAIAGKSDILHWDVLHQLLNQKFPLAIICFLILAVKYNFRLNIRYRNDRLGEETVFTGVAAAKLIFRDGHWVLIVWMPDRKRWIQLLIHSIEEVSCFGDPISQIDLSDPLPPFSVEEFYRNTFSIAKLNGQEPTGFLIRVPKENRKAVMKRRKEGTWEEKEDHYIWKVSAYDEMEIFSYVFKWNGLLKIIGPDKMRDKFKEHLRNILDAHSDD